MQGHVFGHLELHLRVEPQFAQRITIELGITGNFT